MSRLYKCSVEYNEYNPTDKDLEKACLLTYESNKKKKNVKGLNYFSSYNIRLKDL